MVDKTQDKTRIGVTGAAFARWTLASGLSFATVLGLTTLLHENLFVGEKVAFLIPLVVVFVANFFVCRWFVYQQASGPIWQQFVGYALSCVGFRTTEYFVYWILLDCFGVWYVAAVTIVMPISFVTKFLFFGKLVFRRGALRKTAYFVDP